jgi:CheY-like chemotaxis protein
MLARMGYRADVAADGVEALAALERGHHDLVLMDFEMPEMDGIEATRRIRARGASGPQPRIVGLTANASTADHERCFEAGMDACLVKPVRPAELHATLERCAAERAEGRALPRETPAG